MWSTSYSVQEASWFPGSVWYGCVVCQICFKGVEGGNIYDFSRDIIHPPLPQVPVRLIDGAKIASVGPAVVRYLAIWKGHVVAGVFIACREFGVVLAASVAVVVLDTRQDTVGEVISVTDVTTVESKSNALLLNHLEHLAVSSLGVGITHVVQQDGAEHAIVTDFRGSDKAQHIRLGGSVGSLNLVVIRRSWLQVGDLDVVEVLGALGS